MINRNGPYAFKISKYFSLQNTATTLTCIFLGVCSMFMNVRGPMKQKTIANRRYPRDKDINELFLFFPIDLFCASLSSALKTVESKLCNYTF